MSADPLTKIGECDLRCPLCGRTTELWEEVDDGGTARKFVCCTTSELHEEEPCPFYLPPRRFLHPTRREAVQYFEQFIAAAVRARLEASGIAAP